MVGAITIIHYAHCQLIGFCRSVAVDSSLNRGRQIENEKIDTNTCVRIHHCGLTNKFVAQKVFGPIRHAESLGRLLVQTRNAFVDFP